MGPYMYIDCVNESYIPTSDMEVLNIMRWNVPYWVRDKLVPLFNEYADENDGFTLQYPDEGYSCSAWVQKDAIYEFLDKEELPEDVREFLDKIKRFLDLNPAHKYDLQITISY